ncbi:VOC family protein [Xylanimonas ulmi]|uniref:Glyoxalase/bleomycin resistance protein/dioxygenase superfamily protein n=1 Tax=Xylanimonas ulmi TaxID=228973 RepID=A0A4Q7M667_9MICO|nr:VOC family protein [Xylanibacterium ulmi]RZS62142.1 glyoxalase/bleomycin resistance protein/dioxygenase superfamily protein [Xylanibacterium ulmi]
MSHPVALRGLIQVAIVVEDIDKALDHWCELFAIERPQVRAMGLPNDDETYRGQPAHYGMRLAVIEVPGQQVVIELTEPDHHPSTFREFLDKHGEGVHHLGFAVEGRDAVVRDLAQHGHALRVEAFYPGGSWTVVDLEDVLGVNLNIKPA